VSSWSPPDPEGLGATPPPPASGSAGTAAPAAWSAGTAAPASASSGTAAPASSAALASSERCPFDLCDGSGFLYDEETNTAFDCRCRPQRVAQAKARSLSAVIPRRYRDVAFDRPPVTEIEPRRVVAEVRSFVDRIDEHLNAGRGLWFMGPVGTGKTTLAMLVSKSALRAGRSVAIYSLPRLLNEIRDTHRAERSHVNLLDRLAAVDLLHVDDVGAERTTDWVLEELYSIVNARYEDQRSMVVTTNILDREQLCEQITERTVSRLTEMCEELPLLGHDRRMDLRTA
jgi:DNA replication protein DnaC